MNLIIIKNEELGKDGKTVIGGVRAKHIISILKGETGQVLKIGILNGPIGKGTILGISNETVTLQCIFSEELPGEPRIDLILAMPRPKVMKRLLAPLASLGISRIFLTNAVRVERDYFDTHWLKKEYYEPLLIEGLQQASGTSMPEISVIKRLKPFVEDRLDELFPHTLRFLAHPGAKEKISAHRAEGKGILLALGPEGGWVDYEVAMFEEQGFSPVSMGKRILRTDTACIGLVSVIREIVQ
ncbi:16S rRNA (uracil(1498)-N(3))-methyltransferase [Spirochaetota bacterium]